MQRPHCNGFSSFRKLLQRHWTQNTLTDCVLQYQALSKVLPKYPQSAGALFQTYNDLSLGELSREIKM